MPGGRTREHPWDRYPERLVYGIRSIGDVWHKMVWDIVQFENLINNRPTDIVAIPFAYPNVCLSAVALRDWFVDECRQRAEHAGEAWQDATSYAIVRKRVRYSRLAEDVANTFKHRGYRSDHFENAVVEVRVSLPQKLERQRAKLNDWGRALFALKHNDVAIWHVLFTEPGSRLELNALEVFWAWEKDWHALLNSLDMLRD